jgi:hypothetical protein
MTYQIKDQSKRRKIRISNNTLLFLKPLKEENEQNLIYLASKDINEYETEVYVTLTLHKSTFKLLRIFANMYSRKGKEEGRVDEFTSCEITKLVQALAEDSTGPAQKDFPDSLKQHIQRYLKESKNDS